MSLVSVTLIRRRPFDYQLTLWADGVGRWDGSTGHRVGAWQTMVDSRWKKAVSPHLKSIKAGKAATSQGDVLAVERDNKTVQYELPAAPTSGGAWTVAAILDGVAANASWAPLDEAGDRDLSPWASAVPLMLIQSTTAATALGRPEGIVVLAGSFASTATAATLESNYRDQRVDLEASGAFELDGDGFRLTRHLFFERPSAAASVLAGSNTNGRKVWRDHTGRSWADLGFDAI